MINWKVRFKNKTWLLTMGSAIVAFVYQLLGLFGVVPSISEESIVNLIGLAVNMLVGLGIVLDPTTSGVGDSNQALWYNEPKKD